jgi:hypothetical protein
LNEFRNIVKRGYDDIPVQICSNFIYASEFGGHSQPAFYTEFIFPILKKKLRHIDYRSAAELIVSLNKANLLNDKELIKNLIDVLISKTSVKPQFVQFHAWKLNRFDQAETNETNGEKFYYSENHRFYEESNGGVLPQLKHLVREGLIYVRNRVVYPLLYREKRVHVEFDNVNEKEEKQNLINALIEVQKKYQDIKIANLLENLKQ